MKIISNRILTVCLSVQRNTKPEIVQYGSSVRDLYSEIESFVLTPYKRDFLYFVCVFNFFLHHSSSFSDILEQQTLKYFLVLDITCLSHIFSCFFMLHVLHYFVF